MKVKKIGGRPMLDDTQARGKQLNLRLRSEEYNTLRERATESGLSVSEYARQAITNGKVEPRITPETMALVRRLCGMDNNLN
ncbi:MAG: plasmid mobilization relaxosome protein MobC, partial [Rikenellaceae bacterium]